jgi:hypothetical protein
MKAQRGVAVQLHRRVEQFIILTVCTNGSNEYAANIFRAEVTAVNMQFDPVLLSYSLFTTPVGSDPLFSAFRPLPI